MVSGCAPSRRRPHATITVMEAAQKGHLEIVSILLKNGANTKIKEKYRTKKSCPRRRALNISLSCGHKKISKKLNIN